jgi:AbrB family looped-hinge helix DNA binding protein
MTETAIDKFGRVVIPKTVRETYHLVPGEHLIVETYKEGILLKPIHSEPKVVSEDGLMVLDGSVPYNSKPGELIAQSRKERLTRFTE